MLSVSFFVATVATVAMYLVLSRWMERRAAAATMRRLGPRPSAGGAARHSTRPRLIQATDEIGGRLAAAVLERFHIRQSTELLIEQAALKWRASGLLHRSVAMFLAGFALVTLFTRNSTPLMALGAGIAAGMLPLWYVRRKARKRVAAFEEQFPDCLEFLARSMRAGHAFSSALDMVHREYSDPLAGEFRRVFEEQNLGQSLDIVLQKLSQRVPSMDVQFLVSAVLLQKRTGGNLAELLDKLAHLIRERFKLRARIRAVSAQGVMSGRILSAVPLAVAALMFTVNPQYALFFIHDPLGRKMLIGALGLQFIGYLVIRKIVTIEV